MDCYIYYKSKQEHAIDIRHCVELLRTDLRDKMLHQVQLQRRPASTNGLITWMEIYREVPEDFESILTMAVSQCGIQTFIQGERRLEYFIDN